MENINDHLQQLTLAAQKHFDTPYGHQLLMCLWEAIYNSGRLYRPPRNKILGNYDDVYYEALYRLMNYCLRSIHNYNPERGSVLTWINVLLERRFIKEAIAAEQKHLQLLQNPVSLEGLDEFHPLDNYAVSNNSPLLSEQIKRCLQEDPENRFKQAHIPSYPTANFQAIALQYLEGYSLKEIAEQFQMPYTSLVSFYHRRLNSFAPMIRQYCENH